MSEVRLDEAETVATLVDAKLDSMTAALLDTGIVRVPGRYLHPSLAWATAMQIATGAGRADPWCAGMPALEVVGEFTVPPPGSVRRDFQALHIDFGLPRVGTQPVPVPRFTALHRSASRIGSDATTRVVPLAQLLSQRQWPIRDMLIEALRCTVADDAPVEGVLARIIEAADQVLDLPARDSEGFLCGMEFGSIEDEHHYFARHGMQLAAIEDAAVLHPGELLIFDNLSNAHGRRGRRETEELHQLCIGFPSLDPLDQATLLDRVLTRFEAS